MRSFYSESTHGRLSSRTVRLWGGKWQVPQKAGWELGLRGGVGGWSSNAVFFPPHGFRGTVRICRMAGRECGIVRMGGQHGQKGRPSPSGLWAAQRSAECRELIPARQSESNLSSTPPSHLPLQSVLGKGASVRSWQTRFCSVVDHVTVVYHIWLLTQHLNV